MGFLKASRIRGVSTSRRATICAAVVSWWVVDEAAGTDVESAIVEAVPRWLHDVWDFRSVRYSP
jgi:hypothetical protein